MDYQVLILGSDANAYYMARCAYEKTHKKAHLIAKDRLAFTKFSNILTIEYQSDLWDKEKCVQRVNSYLEKHQNEKVLIVSTNETYSTVLSEYADKIRENGYFFKQQTEILESLTNKETFYKTYKNSNLSFPETYYFDVTKNHVIPSMHYPIIVKPANVVLYNHVSFEGKNKIYKVKSEEELKEILEKIRNSKYHDRMILQEFIPGDDSYLFDSVVYVDRFGKVKIISFAQIGIQERTKSMVGNAAALINGLNTFDGNVEEMKENIKKFMEEKIKMNGFYEFDMKYDQRTKTFKVLEINARQGRCSYYISALGCNLIDTMAKDLIFNESLEYKDLKEEVLLSFVPKKVIKKYVLNEEFKKRALRLWKKRVSPMECKLDKNIKRFLMMKRRLHHYIKEYQNSYWEE